MSLFKNSAIVIIGVVVSNLLAYVFHFIAGRMLGPSDYGTFGALMSLFSIVALPTIALSYSLSKFTARFHYEGHLANIATIRRKVQSAVLFFSAIMLAMIILFSGNIAVFLNIRSNTSIIIVAITVIMGLLLPVNRGVLQGMKKFKVYAGNAIIEALFRVTLLVLFLNLGYGVNGAILAYGLAFLIAFLLIFPYIKEIKENVSVDEKATIKPLYRFLFQVLIANAIIQLVINIPSVLIKHFYTSEFTGYWTAALNIARVSLFITASISIVMFPVVSSEKSKENKMKMFYKAAMLVLLVSSSIALVLFVVPEIIILNLYGTSFIEAARILPWMGLAMILVGLLQLRVDFFLAGLK